MSNKLYVKIIVALVAGFLFAGAGTTITYTCATAAGESGCVSFDKAIMHLGDLFHNKQDSLARFFTAFVMASVIVFILLSLISLTKKKKV